MHLFIMLNVIIFLFIGAIVGIVIRYGFDAEKQLYILDCWHDRAKSNSTELPSSVVIVYNNTDYYEYTDGRRVDNNYTAQPQFEDKVLLLIIIILLLLLTHPLYYNYLLIITTFSFWCKI